MMFWRTYFVLNFVDVRQNQIYTLLELQLKCISLTVAHGNIYQSTYLVTKQLIQ